MENTSEQSPSPEEGKKYKLPITIEIDTEAVISDPAEWIGNVLEENREKMNTALEQWAETEEGQKLIKLAEEYQKCRGTILHMRDIQKNQKTSTFSKEDAKAAMLRVEEIHKVVGSQHHHISDTAVEAIYKWVMEQEE